MPDNDLPSLSKAEVAKLRRHFDKVFNSSKTQDQEKIFAFFEQQHFRTCLDIAFNEEMGPDRELDVMSVVLYEPDVHWIMHWYHRDGRKDSYEDSYEAGHQPYERWMNQGKKAKLEFDTNCSVYSWYYAMQYGYEALLPLAVNNPQVNMMRLGVMLSFLSSLEWFKRFKKKKEVQTVDWSKWEEAVSHFVEYWNKPLNIGKVKVVTETADVARHKTYKYKYYPKGHKALKQPLYNKKAGFKKRPYVPFLKTKKSYSKKKNYNKK